MNARDAAIVRGQRIVPLGVCDLCCAKHARAADERQAMCAHACPT